MSLTIGPTAIGAGVSAPQRGMALPSYYQWALLNLAFERTALVTLCAHWNKRWTKAIRENSMTGSRNTPHGPSHPTVSLLMNAFLGLERQGLIELGPSVSSWLDDGYQGVWATKRAPLSPGNGLSTRVFNCIAHGRSPIEDVVARFLDSYPKEPWGLAHQAGIEEAIECGYLSRQEWPKEGIKLWLSWVGIGEDVETVWVWNIRMARNAKVAARLLRKNINNFKLRAPGLYEALQRSILVGIQRGEEIAAHRETRIPVLRGWPAY